MNTVEKLNYLFNDEYLFAVRKPPGIHSVRLPSGGGRSIADLLLEKHPELTHAAPSPLDAGLIQRLDLETSGVILGAKNREVWEKLFEDLKRGSIQKTYAIIIEGAMNAPRTVTTFLGSPYRGAKKVKVYEQEPPKSARALPGTTVIEPIAQDPSRDITLALAHASPARRHQVRAHARYVGHPLVGDTMYGSTRSLPEISATPRAFFLHAWRVLLKHPIENREIVIESDYHAELLRPFS